jgi:serine/threonine-protein kinase
VGEPYDLPQPGEMVGDKYRITRTVATGGMAQVYAAVHVRLGQSVALKILLPEVAAYPELRARFEREARAAAQLRNPHVARVLDVDLMANGAPYIVMELLEGCDLERELRARGRLPPDEAVGYILQACVAMDEAHRRGTVHRDLKPSNVFLCNASDGSARTVKVLDFGISKVLEQGPVPVVTTLLSVLGTPQYMSPEQVRSARDVDARTDVWSLGVMLYEMLTGRLPFTGDSVTAVVSSIAADPPLPMRAVVPQIDPELDAIVGKALSKDRGARYSDAGTLARALRDLSTGVRTAAGRAPAEPPPSAASDPSARDLSSSSGAAKATLPFPPARSSQRRRSRRGRVLTVGGGSLALAALAAFAIIGVRATRTGPHPANGEPASTSNLGAPAATVEVAPPTLEPRAPSGSAPAPVPEAVAPAHADGVEAARPAPVKEKRQSHATPMLAAPKRPATTTRPTTAPTVMTPAPAKAAGSPATSRARAAPRDTDLPSDPG